MTSRQILFCREYLVDLSGAAAARRAGFSPARARKTASELLNDPEIAEHIADLIAERAARAKVTADSVIAELHRVAFAWEITATKVRALELLAKHLGLLDDRFIVTGANGGPIQVSVDDVRARITARLQRLAEGN